jgi:hypothetical protein
MEKKDWAGLRSKRKKTSTYDPLVMTPFLGKRVGRAGLV